MTPADIQTELINHGGAQSGAAKLVVVEGPDEGLEIPLVRSVRIGTEPGSELVLNDPAISRRHAVVSAVGGSIAIKDLGSRNGIFLGGTRVIEAELPMGAVLTMGNSKIALQPRLRMREVAPSAARHFGTLFGESVSMREVFAILERVAKTEVTVLVEGESGTGKELCARAIHTESERASAPYVVFDCASVPHNLAESELFGHVRGSFSGAIADRDGAFQQANGGTICLDEIGELPLDLQPKLLRVLETGEVRRIGETGMRKIDVRVVAATNRDLGAEARRGTFRSDLLYRLDVVKVRMPPLRHRPEDISGLVARLLTDRLAPGDTIGGENLARLVNYAWPGNVRELRNVLDRACALAPRPVTFENLIFNVGSSAVSPLTIGTTYPGVASPREYKDAKKELLNSFDRAYAEALMDRHKGNISRAATAAGLSRRALYDLIARTTGEQQEEG